MKPIEVLKAYVEHTIDVSVFIDHLYNDEEMRKFLSSNLELPRYVKNQAANWYYYLLDYNFSYIYEQRARQRDIAWILDSLKIDYHKSDFYNNAVDKDLEESKKIKPEYLKKKPKWLQDSCWLNDDEGNPLIFVGQLDISPMRHDTAYVYVFYDRNKDQYITIEQAM